MTIESRPPLRIVIADWHRDQAALLQLRRQVFIEEQGVPEELELDELDATARHYLVYSDDPCPIATARLIRETPEQARIGRFAVLATWRRKGVGRRLLDRMIQDAREAGYHRLVLSAQLSAMPLYAAAGFQAYGEIYLDAGIEHRSMKLELSR